MKYFFVLLVFFASVITSPKGVVISELSRWDCFAFARNDLSAEPLEFSGEAQIVEGNQAMARQNAIVSALQNVLRENIRLKLEASQFEKIKDAMATHILKNPYKFVKSFKVIKTSVESNLYKVSVQAMLHEDVLKESLALLGASSFQDKRADVLVMVAEKNLDDTAYHYWWSGESQTSSLSEAAFTVGFRKSGYDVIDTQRVEAQQKLTTQTLELGEDHLSEVSKAYHADFILYGKVWSEGGGEGVVKTLLSLTLYSSRHSRNIFSFSKSYDASLNKTVVENASSAFFDELAKNLLSKTYAGREVEVIISHGPDFKSYQKAVNVLREFSQSLIEKSTKQGQTTLKMKTTKTLEELADTLESQRWFKVQVKNSRLIIEVRDDAS